MYPAPSVGSSEPGEDILLLLLTTSNIIMERLKQLLILRLILILLRQTDLCEVGQNKRILRERERVNEDLGQMNLNTILS